MKKIIQFAYLLFLFMGVTNTAFGQEKATNNPDVQLKETLYIKYKREAQTFDKKAFDNLFLEFFQKQRDPKLMLTKEEYYAYTLKIAAYSEKLGLLYKDQKEASQRTKEEWFGKNYSDYLNSKK
jgi:hypothetical protein